MLASDLALCTELRHELHAHPELSGQEVWTRQRLIRFLREHTDLTVFEQEHYFYAWYAGRDGQPAIAFRADYDALPVTDDIDAPYRSQFDGLGHKCGHDGHAATLCALALEVCRIRPERSVIFLFQPAEETGEGAKQCLDIFERHAIGEFYAYHNYPGEPLQTVALKPQTICLTSKGLNLFFKGKPSHASQPEAGINPAYTIAEIIRTIQVLQTDSTLFKGFFRCTIVHVSVGEEAFGVSAGEGVLRLTIRAYYDDDLSALERVICNTARILSAAKNIEFSYSGQEYFPATVNHEAAVDKVFAACERIGQPCKTLAEPFRASEDFGYFLQRVPGAMLFVGNGEQAPALHTPEFDFPDVLIENTVNVFMALIQSDTYL